MMTRYGKPLYEIDKELMDNIASYMLDEERELVCDWMVHTNAEDDNEAFLRKYLEYDEGMKYILFTEFGITMEDEV